MKQVIFFALELLCFALPCLPAERDPEATAWVESRLRAALRESFRLDSQIETLEVLDWAPNVAAFAVDRRIVLEKNGLRCLRSTAGDVPREFVWSGTSLNADSRLQTPLRIRFRMAAWVERIAALRDIGLGERIDPATLGPVKVAWQATEPADLSGCCHPDSYAGKRAGRTLRQGAIVRREFLVPSPLVTAGQTISIVSGSAGLSLRMEAVASQSGQAGELIFFKRLDNGVRLRGVIQPDGTVSLGAASESIEAKAAKR
jgi:flagella basal body P-ring formation protein FlgA